MVLLTPHLTAKTASEFLRAAAHKSKSETEHLLAERFPWPDALAWVEAIPASSVTRSVEQHAPGRVEEELQLVPERVGEQLQPVPQPVQAQQAPAHVDDRSKVKPLAPQSFAVQFTLSRALPAA